MDRLDIAREEVEKLLESHRGVSVEIAKQIDDIFDKKPMGARIIVTLALVDQLFEQMPPELRLPLANSMAALIMRNIVS